MRAKWMKSGAFGLGAIVPHAMVETPTFPEEVIALAGAGTVVGAESFGVAEAAQFEVGGSAGFAGGSGVTVVTEAGAGSAVAVAVFFSAAVIFVVWEGSYHLRA